MWFDINIGFEVFGRVFGSGVFGVGLGVLGFVSCVPVFGLACSMICVYSCVCVVDMFAWRVVLSGLI